MTNLKGTNHVLDIGRKDDLYFGTIVRRILAVLQATEYLLLKGTFQYLNSIVFYPYLPKDTFVLPFLLCCDFVIGTTRNQYLLK